MKNNQTLRQAYIPWRTSRKWSKQNRKKFAMAEAAIKQHGKLTGGNSVFGLLFEWDAAVPLPGWAAWFPQFNQLGSGAMAIEPDLIREADAVIEEITQQGTK